MRQRKRLNKTCATEREHPHDGFMCERAWTRAMVTDGKAAKTSRNLDPDPTTYALKPMGAHIGVHMGNSR